MIMKAFKDFINLCNYEYSQKDNIDQKILYSPSSEFENLAEEKRSEIIKFINYFDFRSLYAYEKLPQYIQNNIKKRYDNSSENSESQNKSKEIYNSLLPKDKINLLKDLSSVENDYESKEGDLFNIDITTSEYNMIEDLKKVLYRADALNSTIKETYYFTGKFSPKESDQEIMFEDVINIDLVTAKIKGGVWYINDEPITIEQKESFAELSYETKIKEKFLNQLDKSYYEKLASEGMMDTKHLIERGMIRQIANSIANSSDYMTRKVMCMFENGNSFLHYAVRNMEVRELDNFINFIPEDFVKDYLELKNKDGNSVYDLVVDQIDKKQLIEGHIRQSNAIDDPQGIHGEAVHRSSDESLVSLAKRILEELGKSFIIEEGAKITFNHDDISDFVKDKISELQRDLDQILIMEPENFYKNISQFFNEEQKSLDISDTEISDRLAFYHFQVEKAKALIDDIIDTGCTNSNPDAIFRVYANLLQPNGLSIKEIAALCYYAIKDEDRLIVGMKSDEEGGTVSKYYNELTTDTEKEEFLNEMKWLLIDSLYSIRRGYNIGHGDDPDKFIFNSDNDLNICQGGTVNKFVENLSNRHEDIHIAAITRKTLQDAIYNLHMQDIINKSIDDCSNDQKQHLVFLLNCWKRSNKMSTELQEILYRTMESLLSDTNHPIIKEYGKYLYPESIKRIAREGLSKFSCKKGIDIPQLEISIGAFDDTNRISDFLNHIPKYTIDEKGNHQLTLLSLLKINPEMMLDLLGERYALKDNYYLLKNNRVVHVMLDWLEEHSELLYTKKISVIRRAWELVIHDMRSNPCNPFLGLALKGLLSNTPNYILNEIITDLTFSEISQSLLPFVIKEKMPLIFEIIVEKASMIITSTPWSYNDIIGDFFKIIPKDQIYLLVDALSEISKQNPYIYKYIIKDIPADCIYLFVNGISKVYEERPNLKEIIECMPNYIEYTKKKEIMDKKENSVSTVLSHELPNIPVITATLPLLEPIPQSADNKAKKTSEELAHDQNKIGNLIQLLYSYEPKYSDIKTLLEGNFNNRVEIIAKIYKSNLNPKTKHMFLDVAAEVALNTPKENRYISR